MMRSVRADSKDQDVEKCRMLRCTEATCLQRNVCFFCEQSPGPGSLHEAATFQVDKKVKACAVVLEQQKLLALENSVLEIW